MFGFLDCWFWLDEWYEFSNLYDVIIYIVLVVDEYIYNFIKIWFGQVVKGMGVDYLVSWWYMYEKGCVFVMVFGYNVEMYCDWQYLDYLWGGIWWVVMGYGKVVMC